MMKFLIKEKILIQQTKSLMDRIVHSLIKNLKELTNILCKRSARHSLEISKLTSKVQKSDTFKINLIGRILLRKKCRFRLQIQIRSLQASGKKSMPLILFLILLAIYPVITSKEILQSLCLTNHFPTSRCLRIIGELQLLLSRTTKL